MKTPTIFPKVAGYALAGLSRKSPWAFVALLLLSITSFAQMEGNHWHFGNRAGIDFNLPGPTVSDPNGQLNTQEGCAVASDVMGNLLFYTDGTWIYNAAHAVVNPLNPLGGNTSSTQSATIIPRPCHEDIYYIATTDAWNGTNGVRIYEVDISTWTVSAPTTIVAATPACERLAVTQHANGSAYWLTTTLYTNTSPGTLLVMEITSAGLGTPQLVQTGPSIFAMAAHPIKVGYMKFSPDGQFLAAVRNDNIDVYRFNNGTGALNHWLTLVNGCHFYGLEFSPDSRYLYATNWVFPSGCGPAGRILRYDLFDPNPQATQTVIATSTVRYLAMQLTPHLAMNQRNIYVATLNQNFLSEIQDPELATPTFVHNAFSIAPRISTGGLPQYIARADALGPCFSVTGPLPLPGAMTQPTFNFRGGIQLVDLNNDGLDDMAYLESHRSAGLSANIWIRWNIGTATAPAFSATPVLAYAIPTLPTTIHPISFYFYDYNSDNIQDLFFLGWHTSGAIMLSIQHVPGLGGLSFGPRTDLTVNGTTNIPSNTDISSFIIGKVEASDPLASLWLARQNTTDEIQVAEAITSLNFAAPSTIDAIPLGFPWWASFANIRLLDGDCDGDNDVFVGISTDVLYYECLSPSTLTYATGIPAAPFGITGVSGSTEWLIPNFSDLDGDGCVDLLTAKQGPGGLNPSEFLFYKGTCGCNSNTGLLAIRSAAAQPASVYTATGPEKQPEFQLQPNPAGSRFSVVAQEGSVEALTEIRIWDLQGREVGFVKQKVDNRIHIQLNETMPAQVLLVELKTGGGKSTVLKLVTQPER